jgi:hypothetical protein
MSKGVLAFLERTTLTIFHPKFLQRVIVIGKGARQRQTILDPVERSAPANKSVGLKKVPVGEWFQHRGFRLLLEPIALTDEEVSELAAFSCTLLSCERAGCVFFYSLLV